MGVNVITVMLFAYVTLFLSSFAGSTFCARAGGGARFNAGARFNSGAGAGAGNSTQGLQDNFYQKSCPEVENIVKQTVTEFFRRDRTLTAGFLRFYFHDCFVEGCDASLLLDANPTGEPTEMRSAANGDTIHGLETIHEIKRRLEAKCPGIVSCSDIMTYAMRDVVVLSGLPFYKVQSGRRDGKSSLLTNVGINLPSPFAGVASQEESFRRKGMTLEDLVALLGAHSIGVSHCSSFDDRINNPRVAQRSPPMDAAYMNQLQMRCPRDGSFFAMFINKRKVTVPLTPTSGERLGVAYYRSILNRRGLLVSDSVLAESPKTRRMVQKFASNQRAWVDAFVKAMQKLSTVGVLVGNEGEVRTSCRRVNG